MEKILSLKSHGKWADKKIVMEKSWISLLLIMNHAREVLIIPYVKAYCSDLAIWEVFGYC